MCLVSQDFILGQVVHSRAGRDKDKYFMIVGIINKDYVLISDGDLRKIEKPKKKKTKHLVAHDSMAFDIKGKLEANMKVSNSDVKKFLMSLGLFNQSENKEV
jgi:ribosomal protein L14E/L6E/L27E